MFAHILELYYRFCMAFCSNIEIGKTRLIFHRFNEKNNMNKRIQNPVTKLQAVSSENIAATFSITSPSRMIALAAIIMLTGCGITATQPLWRSNLAAQQTATQDGTAISDIGETYQIFTANADFQLRKLSPNGQEQWRSTFGNVTSQFTQPLIAITGASILVTSDVGALTSFNGAGDARWSRDVTPPGAQIKKLLTSGDDTIASYSGAGLPSGIVAVSAAGEERWRYEFPANASVQLAALATGNLLAVTDNGIDNLALLYLFDSAGNLLQQQSIPVTAKRVSLVSRGNSIFLMHNDRLTRIDETGNTLWTQTLTAYASCTAADEGEVACWEQRLPIVFPPYASPGYAEIIWYGADGTVKNKLIFPESFSLFTSIETLHYNGDHRWTLEKFVSSPLNLFSSSTVRRFNHYNQFSVITEQGYNLKTITMQPSVFEDSFPGYTNDGDNATVIVSRGHLYAVGNTRLTARGFVSVYPIAP